MRCCVGHGKRNFISTNNRVVFCFSYQNNSPLLSRKFDFINEWKCKDWQSSNENRRVRWRTQDENMKMKSLQKQRIGPRIFRPEKSRLKKHWKICIAYRKWRSNLPRRRRKPKYGKKTESFVISGFGHGVTRGWERKSPIGGFASSRFWPCAWKISPVGKDQDDSWEFFTGFVLFLTQFFVLSLSANVL